MTWYKCGSCGAAVEQSPNRINRCPECYKTGYLCGSFKRCGSVDVDTGAVCPAPEEHDGKCSAMIRVEWERDEA